MRPFRNFIGAGEGNRTLVFSLEGCCSTIELHPLIKKVPYCGTAGKICISAPAAAKATLLNLFLKIILQKQTDFARFKFNFRLLPNPKSNR